MEAATAARRPAAAAAAAAAAPATAPTRTPAKRPRSRPVPGKRTAPRRKKATARTAPAPAPSRRKAPARKAPSRRSAAARTAPGRISTGQLIPIAFGTAARVKRLPDSGLVVRMTQGRAWIAVLGVLLVGIVALNVFTLSIAAGAGHVDENVQALEKENTILGARVAAVSGAGRVRHEAAGLGLTMSDVDGVTPINAAADDAAVAAERLAGAGPGY